MRGQLAIRVAANTLRFIGEPVDSQGAQAPGPLGIDTASYAASSSGVAVNLAAGAGSGGDAQGDTLANIENLIGSAYADALTGDAGANSRFGLARERIRRSFSGLFWMIAAMATVWYLSHSIAPKRTASRRRGWSMS